MVFVIFHLQHDTSFLSRAASRNHPDYEINKTLLRGDTISSIGSFGTKTGSVHTISTNDPESVKNTITSSISTIIPIVKKPEKNVRDVKLVVNEVISSTIHAVTYASHRGRDDRFCRAVESAVRNDINLVILGWGVPWRGLSQKLEAAHAYTSSLPATDIILFTDAFDVLYTSSLQSINESFLSLKSDIIFSAECGCWPHVAEDRDVCFTGYPISPTPYRYLNSGTWIGFADPSAKMLQSVIKEAGKDFGNANDQKLIADFYIANRFGIKLDFSNKLFQSMHMTLDPPLPHCNPVEDVVLDKSTNTWFNKLTKSTPAVLHFNGGGKSRHLFMEGQMWYKRPEHNSKEDLENLKSRRITVPSQLEGSMRFDEICGDYIHSEYGIHMQ